MIPPSHSFEQRVQEIKAYLELLDELEKQVQVGKPRIGTSVITPQQQRILYSAVYLQLYNLVEATVAWCMSAVCEASHAGGWRPADLSAEVRKEWVRTKARTHVSLNGEKRLTEAISFCEHLIQSLPVERWEMDRRNSGSWDDIMIEDLAAKLGCKMSLSSSARSRVKRKVRDDKTILFIIKKFRNELAHGSLSFTECGEGATVTDLRQIFTDTTDYLRQVVQSFEGYISRFEFLIPSKRPAVGDA
jgi:hypothetical protein